MMVVHLVGLMVGLLVAERVDMKAAMTVGKKADL